MSNKKSCSAAKYVKDVGIQYDAFGEKKLFKNYNGDYKNTKKNIFR